MQTEKYGAMVNAGKIAKVDRYNWQVQDAPGHQQMINKNWLLVDSSYQRNVSDAKVLNIAREWSWIACATIVVALRDGKFYVIDGQHRVMAALRRADITYLPCIVFKITDVANEAQGFLTIQTQRKAMYSAEKFKALTITENPAALFVQNLVAQSGRIIDRSSEKNTVACISLLLKLAETAPDMLQRIWPLVVLVCKGYPLHNRILEGFMYLESNMHAGESLMNKNWFNRIEKVGYAALLDSAAKASAFYSRGSAKVWAYGMLEALNKNMRNRLDIQRPE